MVWQVQSVHKQTSHHETASRSWYLTANHRFLGIVFI